MVISLKIIGHDENIEEYKEKTNIDEVYKNYINKEFVDNYYPKDNSFTLPNWNKRGLNKRIGY